MDKIFPNFKEFVALKDNSYLSIAVNKHSNANRKSSAFEYFITSENNGKENILDLANFPKPIFANSLKNISKNYPFQ